MSAVKQTCVAAVRSLTRPTWSLGPISRRPIRPLTTSVRPYYPQYQPLYGRYLNARYQSTAAIPDPPATTIPAQEQPARKPWRAAPHRRPDEPVYELYFTCKTCKHRSGHSISKQGYHSGTVLVQCPGCNNRHLISDHLKIFSDKSVTLEDLMREKGESVRIGGVDGKGDVEFWEDKAGGRAERGSVDGREGQTRVETQSGT